jgi:hypothetical protein
MGLLPVILRTRNEPRDGLRAAVLTLWHVSARIGMVGFMSMHYGGDFDLDHKRSDFAFTSYFC